ncbi:MAG: cyclase family protein, partial [Nonomuraea sp.]|nr:cyclase family protein [Nonomuraea sp.]
PGLLLDLTAADGDTITATDLERAMKAAGHRPDPGDIVLLDTGAARWAGQRRYFTDFRGLGGDGVELLLDLGVRVIGTDAFSLDAPFAAMIARYRETGDPAALWPAHFAGRRREFCQLERLANLSALPAPTGFTVACFPVKIARAGAAWARAVALISEPGGAAAATPP